MDVRRVSVFFFPTQVLSYQRALKFSIPNAPSQTLAPQVNVAYNCKEAAYTPTQVTCLAPNSTNNNCGFPRTMFTGTDSLGVCFGHAYGLVTSMPPPNVGGGPVCGFVAQWFDDICLETNQRTHPCTHVRICRTFPLSQCMLEGESVRSYVLC